MMVVDFGMDPQVLGRYLLGLLGLSGPILMLLRLIAVMNSVFMVVFATSHPTHPFAMMAWNKLFKTA